MTILNIIANLLVNNKTVEIVSNNNSATINVLDKLSSPKYNMGFLVALLGNTDNKNAFIQNQTGHYPDISSWQMDVENQTALQTKIQSHVIELIERDRMKDHILELYGIRLLRLPTNGSSEIAKVGQALDEYENSR